MKKNALLNGLCVATLVFAGCSNEENELLFNAGNVLNASMEPVVVDVQSRVGFDSENNYKFFWHQGDAISVKSGTNGSFYKFAMKTLSEEKDYATFSGLMSGVPADYAVYPYSRSNKLDGNTLTVTLPTSYTYDKEDTRIGDPEGNNFNPVMYSKIVKNQDLHFAHLGGIYAVTLEDLPAGDNKFRFTVDANITGEFTADLSATTPMITSGEATEANTVEFSFNVAEEGTTRYFYIPVPCGEHKNITLSLEKDASGEEFTYVFGDYTMERRRIKLITVLSSDLGAGGEGLEVEPVTSVAALKEALTNGDKKIVLGTNIELSEILTIEKDVVLDGNGKTLTSTAGRAINVSGAANVTIKNLTINCSGERGVNLIENAKNVTLDNVTATAANYTVNVAASAPGATITIKNSDLTGLNAVNIAGKNTTVNITDTKITCNDNNANEEYGAITIGANASGSKVTVTGGEMVVNGGSSAGIVSSADASIEFSEETAGTPIVKYMNYSIDYGTDYYYTTETFASALEVYREGAVIKLIRDVKVTEQLTISKGATVVLDLNNYTMSNISTATGANHNMIDVNGGTLTIKNGTVTTKHEGTDMGWNNSTNVFNVTAGGVLNLESVVAKNLGGSAMAFVAHLNNWGEVTLNVKNSTLESTYIPVRVFNAGNDMNNVTIKGSELKGKYCFWVHFYSLVDFGNDQSKYEAHKALLNFDFFNGGESNNNNTFTYNNTKNAPVLYGFDDTIYFDEYGRLLADAGNEQAIVEALKGGNDVVLTSSFEDFAVNTTAPYGNYYGIALNGGVLDGNGYTLDFALGELKNNKADNYGIMTSGGTIKNVTVTGVFRGIMIMNPTEDIVIDNVTIGGEDVCYAINTGEGDGTRSLTVTNSTIKGWSSYGNAIKDLNFANCTFAQGEYYTNVFGRLVKPYVNTVFDSCEFNSKFYIDLSQLGKDGDGNVLDADAKIVLKNCTVNGVKLTAENWKNLIAAESDCGEGQISVELKDGSYLSASNTADYVVIE